MVPYSYKEQSFHCNATPTNSATCPKEGPKSKRPSLERANVKAGADNRPLVRMSIGCATARPNLKANAPYWIRFQGSAPNRPMFQRSKKSRGPMVFLAAHANLVFPKDPTRLECYGTPQISFFDPITLAPLLGEEFCQPMVRLWRLHASLPNVPMHPTDHAQNGSKIHRSVGRAGTSMQAK